MPESEDITEYVNPNRGQLLRRLGKKLINITGNDLLDKKLSGRGSARVFNVYDEASQFVLNDLMDGKKLTIVGIKEEDEQYFADEETPRFRQIVDQVVNDRATEGLGTSKEILRQIKDQTRIRLGLPSAEELVPDRKVDLIYGDPSDITKDRHVDDELQTDLMYEFTLKLLQKIEAERIHILRERGLDSLYIAFGFLEWKKEDHVKNKFKNYNSPLCLMRVNLESEKRVRFKLVSNGDLEENTDLVEALKIDTGNTPPSLDDFWVKSGKQTNFSLKEFHKAYSTFVEKYSGWNVRNRIAVGIFKSRGIHPSEIDPNGFGSESVDRTEKLLEGIGYRSDPNGDRSVDKKQNRELVPAFALPVDSSQHSAVLEVAEGRDMVIEGPPGTGKSHTIVNLVTDAIRQGKSVLFLAQKIVALDVVYNRLKELGLDKKCIRLYSSTATKTFLYGESGEISKKLSPPRESTSNGLGLANTCNLRDECLTELNDFAHLMLKEIHGETYQNIITTSKVHEHNIGKEPKPKFRLRNNFNLKNEDGDMLLIREISQIIESLDETSKSLLETIRCKENDPFKIDELTDKASKIIFELQPFLEHYGTHSIETCESHSKDFNNAYERKLLMEQTFNDLIQRPLAELRGDGGDFDQVLGATTLSQVSLNSFDSKTATQIAETAYDTLEALFNEKSQLEDDIQWCTNSLQELSNNFPNYQFKVSSSNRSTRTDLIYPKELTFYDDKLLIKDIEKFSEGLTKIRQASENIAQVRESCFDLKPSLELQSNFDLLQAKNFSFFYCNLPFSKASKSRKYFKALFKEKVSLGDLKRKVDDLITLTKKIEEIESNLQSEGILGSEGNVEIARQTLETFLEKLRAVENLSKKISAKNYLDDPSGKIGSELDKILLIIEKTKLIDSIKFEFSESGLKEVNSTQIKVFVETFDKLKSKLEIARNTASDFECDFIPTSVQEVYALLVSITESKTSLNKIFAVNANIEAIDKNKGIGDWLRELFKQDVSVEEKYVAHLYRHVTEKISDKDRKVFEYRQKHYDNLKIRFSELEDKSRKELTRELRTKMPRKDQIPSVHKAKVGEKRGLSLLEHVAQRNARVTVRELCHRATDALKHYCNCFFMTPSSVAHYLPKDATFDLLIIDEASQMLPEESVGSILRSKQVVVVGDPKQMPPYRGMVSTLFDEEAEDLEDDDGIDKQTSILDLAAQTFKDYRRLRYHYRSEDENLIRFSNQEFYDNDLITIPNQHEDPDLGVKHFAVNGVYNVGKDGGSRNPNPIEADELVALIIKEARDHPDWSLGVAVINKQQAIRVEEILRERTMHDQKFRDFESRWSKGSEYFFIKNLENVQGDERDTMLIATVYGRDKDGKAHNRFGPINFNKGENRINVLVTRAKKRVVVCSSIIPNDITSNSKGAQVFRRYLQYAMTGTLDGTVAGHVGESDHWYDAPWEKWFHDRLEADGFIVDPQVGVSSWRIDLGVKHHDYPAGYICGIELDGPDHLRLSARDRDIERQSILEKKGWTIFRVWSMDFFNDMEGEYQIIKKAVESTLREKVAALQSEQPKESEKVEELSTASPSEILGY
jgi:superfamily I DNA and/or RNA helicase/very-short-patch-repair endonuclease